MSKPLSNTMTPLKNVLNKVPEVTIMFWIIKLLSTFMGEAASDFLSSLGEHRGGPPSGMGHGPGGPQSGMSISFTPFMGIMCSVLILTMIIQIRSKHYEPWKYWLNVAAVAVFGTAAADAVHLGSLMITSSVFAAILAVVLITWYITEKTLDVHNINTLRREIFYWATVLATFMLGTALGDFTAMSLHLGNFVSGLMFIGLIAVPAVAYKLFGMNEIASFWFAYIITRPLGASFADWLAHERGLGTGPVSLVSTIIILALVAYVSFNSKKEKETIFNPKIA
ncbi:hypothetical protein [Desulfosporosinus sp. FKB]|uniref:COG4705 family protein n=1 Tax=Desulfosporosinus sp. FKB TaxID=1969835 RepID=UPI000B49D93A|nr:hypothetical protein [Desulfosporosinus sp. FKB]